MSLRSQCVSFHQVPHSSALFNDFLYDFERVARFFRRSPAPRQWFADQARSLDYAASRRAQIADILERQNRSWGASQRTLGNIARFRDGACVAVTGQQVGLFGGPLFAILKAISAVRLADESSQAGVPCAPVFWLATEDHDLAEVNHATFRNGEELRTLTTSSQGAPDAPLSSVVLGDDVPALVRQASELLGGEMAAVLADAYRPGETFGSAFARLYARLFAEYGVILLDPSDPEIHQIVEPVYRRAIENAAGLAEALLGRGRELTAVGYHEQVKVTPSSTLLFALHEGARVAIHRANGGYSVGGERLTQEQLLARLKNRPDEFSANVLLRPVVQDYLLPTLAYFGGPAEVAYFAQAAVVYEDILGRVTPVLPRLSLTLVDAASERLLDRYHLQLADLFHGMDRLRDLIAERVLPAELQAALDRARDSVEISMQAVSEQLVRLDSTLVDASSRAAAKMRHQIDHLRTRAAKAEERRSQIITRHAALLSATLFPHKSLQERVLTGIEFLAREPGLLPMLYEAATGTPREHCLLFTAPR